MALAAFQNRLEVGKAATVQHAALRRLPHQLSKSLKVYQQMTHFAQDVEYVENGASDLRELCHVVNVQSLYLEDDERR